MLLHRFEDERRRTASLGVGAGLGARGVQVSATRAPGDSASALFALRSMPPPAEPDCTSCRVLGTGVCLATSETLAAIIQT